MTNEISKRPEAGLTTDYADLMRVALDKGADGVEALERLVALKERAYERMAAQEFADAMALFQEKCPPIRKSSSAHSIVCRALVNA